MKIFITGGSGFVGKHLAAFLLNNGHQVTVTGTRPYKKENKDKKFSYIQADTTQKGSWQEALQNTDAVVNLAGKNIFHRWSAKYKKEIYDTRILTTRNIVEGLPKDKGIVLCSTSAAGYYGDKGDEILTEDSSNGNDFLAEVCKDWEKEAFQAKEKGVRVVTTRFGVVLGKDGGAMKKMLFPFRFGVGGPLGSGMQWFTWIHIDDLLSAILFLLENEKAEGAFNFTAPNPVRNKELAKIIGHILNRPAFMPVPGFMIRTVMGELGTALLASQRAVPEKLLKQGFNFKYKDIQPALENLVKTELCL